MVSSIAFLQPPLLFLAFQFHLWNESAVSLQTATFHPSLGFPMGLLTLKQSHIAFWAIWQSSILTIWPFHCSQSRHEEIKGATSYSCKSHLCQILHHQAQDIFFCFGLEVYPQVWHCYLLFVTQLGRVGGGGWGEWVLCGCPKQQKPRDNIIDGQMNIWNLKNDFLYSPCFKLVSQIKVNSIKDSDCIIVHNFWLRWPFGLFTLVNKILAMPLILMYFTSFSTFHCVTAADSCSEKAITGRFVLYLFGSWNSFALYNHAFRWENCV